MGKISDDAANGRTDALIDSCVMTPSSTSVKKSQIEGCGAIVIKKPEREGEGGGGRGTKRMRKIGKECKNAFFVRQRKNRS